MGTKKTYISYGFHARLQPRPRKRADDGAEADDAAAVGVEPLDRTMCAAVKMVQTLGLF